ncbi:MAG: hypothetical protein DHS20C15_28450 [Planctomycetota bacterium]|nr:MAG: hypothetical protein DHS20C15_28450 [Planctomycetota bacterium]
MVLLAAVAVAGALWWVSDDAARVEPAALDTPAVELDVAPELPAAIERAVAALPEPVTRDAPAALAEPIVALGAESLVLTVRHAQGAPAARAIAVVYDTLDRQLAHGELDGDGRWVHPGLDRAVEIYIVGASADFGRLSLDIGRGTHELVLPDGASLSGYVTVDGAPPGKRFAVSVRDVVRLSDLPDNGVGLRRITPDGEAFVSGGTTYAEADGSFRVSGFSAEGEVRVGGPGEPYLRVEEASSPKSVPVPYDGYVLALRRMPVVRGRVLRSDGSPASDAVLKLSKHFTRAVPPGSSLSVMATINSSAGQLINERGEFELPLGEFEGRTRCYDSATESILDDDEACGPLELVVSVLATHPSGESVEDERRIRRFDQDVDFGDLWMVRNLAHRLRVLDAQRVPIEGASFELEAQDAPRAWMASATLRSDAEGMASFLAEDADLGFVTVSAERHESQRVELPAVPQSAPIDVTLTPATMLTLNVAWPSSWGDEDIGVWYVELSGTAPVLRDRGRRTPVVKKGNTAKSGAGSFQRAVSADGPTHGEPVAYEIKSAADSVLLDGLQPNAALHLRLHSRHPNAKSEGEPPPDISFWESEELWLERGEHRVIDVDLRMYEGDPPGDDG